MFGPLGGVTAFVHCTPAHDGNAITKPHRLDAVFAPSLARWQHIATGDSTCAPWWPAHTERLPAAASAAALAAVQRARDAADSPRLRGLAGSLRLRQQHTEAALADLTAAVTAQSSPPPELLADLAIAQRRSGDASAGAATLDRLQAMASGDDAFAHRSRRAAARAGDPR
jgi:hypothetical protein